jgi:hypothetical protein
VKPKPAHEPPTPPETPRDLTGTFVARLGEFGIVVVDGAKADDPRGDASAMVKLLHDQFTEIAVKVPMEA